MAIARRDSPDWPFFEHHFTEARLRHYVDHCDGDTNRAMQLYVWNAELSAAFWESLGHIEVALRDAIDAQMNLRQRAKQRGGAWIYDDARELGRDRRGRGYHDYPYTDIEAAKKRVARNGKSLDAGQIISELSFGFWHQLVSRRQRFLWPDLAAAFPQ